jgi:hypothetical protein
MEVDVRTRPVTHAMRMGLLRALGIDLRLPVEYPTIDSTALQPIPRQVSSIWVGDKVISRALLENLGSNARRLSESQYAYRLFLSNATPEAYRENLRLLAEHAPTLQVVPWKSTRSTPASSAVPTSPNIRPPSTATAAWPPTSRRPAMCCATRCSTTRAACTWTWTTPCANPAGR